MSESSEEPSVETPPPVSEHASVPDQSGGEVTPPPPLQDALAQVLRRLVYRGQQELERVASNGRTRMELRQAQKDLDHFWIRLGKTAYHLQKGGELSHPAILKAVERIDELESKIDEMRAP